MSPVEAVGVAASSRRVASLLLRPERLGGAKRYTPMAGRRDWMGGLIRIGISLAIRCGRLEEGYTDTYLLNRFYEGSAITL